MSPARRARTWKTALRFGAPDLYHALLDHEIEAAKRRAARDGLILAIRLDGSSDLGDAQRVAKRHPDVIFYDYTKSSKRAHANARGEHPKNWHVSLSYTGYNAPDCRSMIRYGGTVSVVFDARPGDPKPEQWWGCSVIDGDVDDLRFLDPASHVVGLGFKAARDRAGHRSAAGRFLATTEDVRHYRTGYRPVA